MKEVVAGEKDGHVGFDDFLLASRAEAEASPRFVLKIIDFDDIHSIGKGHCRHCFGIP